jgi:hypothetical protein
MLGVWRRRILTFSVMGEDVTLLGRPWGIGGEHARICADKLIVSVDAFYAQNLDRE